MNWNLPDPTRQKTPPFGTKEGPWALTTRQKNAIKHSKELGSRAMAEAELRLAARARRQREDNELNKRDADIAAKFAALNIQMVEDSEVNLQHSGAPIVLGKETAKSRNERDFDQHKRDVSGYYQLRGRRAKKMVDKMTALNSKKAPYAEGGRDKQGFSGSIASGSRQALKDSRSNGNKQQRWQPKKNNMPWERKPFAMPEERYKLDIAAKKPEVVMEAPDLITFSNSEPSDGEISDNRSTK